MKSKFQEGDWVVVMSMDLVPPDISFSTYEAIPCKVIGIRSDGFIMLSSPCKVCWGKPPLDKANEKQLIKISKKDAEDYIKRAFAIDTYKRTRDEYERDENGKEKIFINDKI